MRSRIASRLSALEASSGAGVQFVLTSEVGEGSVRRVEAEANGRTLQQAADESEAEFFDRVRTTAAEGFGRRHALVFLSPLDLAA